MIDDAGRFKLQEVAYGVPYVLSPLVGMCVGCSRQAVGLHCIYRG